MRPIVRTMVLFTVLLGSGWLWATPKDPTRPDMFSAAAAPELSRHLKLTSVLISSSRRQALINERLLGVGDSIDGLVVARIDPRGVALHGGDSRLYLTLGAADIKNSLPRANHPEKR